MGGGSGGHGLSIDVERSIGHAGHAELGARALPAVGTEVGGVVEHAAHGCGSYEEELRWTGSGWETVSRRVQIDREELRYYRHH